MRKTAALLAACALSVALGAVLSWSLAHRAKDLPDAPALVLRVREVARLETLDVTLYKKVDFAPDPAPTQTLWDGVAQWARYTLKAPRGRAIVFAHAHLGVDLARLDERSLRVAGRRVELVLPRPQVSVELLPAETEVIGSNLDAAETAQLFALARDAFTRQVEADAALRERALESARRALRALFFQAGFSEVAFPESLQRTAVN
ncbi:MAG: hypothetical protein NVSMB23_06660 [Myxococcales bacterium]